MIWSGEVSRVLGRKPKVRLAESSKPFDAVSILVFKASKIERKVSTVEFHRAHYQTNNQLKFSALKGLGLRKVSEK
jgi:hypothetical protein